MTCATNDKVHDSGANPTFEGVSVTVEGRSSSSEGAHSGGGGGAKRDANINSINKATQEAQVSRQASSEQ